MLGKKKLFFLVFMGFLILNPSYGDSPTEVVGFTSTPTVPTTLENVVVDSMVTAMATAYTRINMHLGCFATNLRSVVNPVSEFSMVTVLLDLYNSSGNVQTHKFRFPAEFLKRPSQWIYTASDMNKLIKVIEPANGVRIRAYENTIQLLVPHLKLVTLTLAGEVENLSEKSLTLSGVRFIQGPIPTDEMNMLRASFATAGRPFPVKYEPGEFVGFNGPLSSRVNWYISNDTGSVDISVDFPGAASLGQAAGVQYSGFCGGFYSPLVLFFKNKFPNFTVNSKFQLIENQSNNIYWPEKGSEAYFLVYDKNSNGKIDGGGELFGDRDGFRNGFENLASFDSNKDKVIDQKDPMFSKLKLWYDKNADGVSQKEELFSLGTMGVESISLKYENETKKFGDRAEYRQKSTFKFSRNKNANNNVNKNANNNEKQVQEGVIIDLWLGSTGGL
ncbi:MAG: hypothetical protein K1X29_08870 [Bdellovibrionales bacterium]|nr:hypothetical protein [Bdellovibrionales bacterium]